MQITWRTDVFISSWGTLSLLLWSDTSTWWNRLLLNQFIRVSRRKGGKSKGEHASNCFLRVKAFVLLPALNYKIIISDSWVKYSGQTSPSHESLNTSGPMGCSCNRIISLWQEQLVRMFSKNVKRYGFVVSIMKDL